MKVTDNRKITIEIDGTKHKVSFDEAQELYRELGKIAGIAGPYRLNYGGGIISSGSMSYVGEHGPELVTPSIRISPASVEDASRWITVKGDLGVSGEQIERQLGKATSDDPDEDDPPMAVAV